MFNAQLPPDPNASTLEDVVLWVTSQFEELEQESNSMLLGGLPKLYAEPEKPREGRFVNADGTVWNPGAGAGIYVYHDSTWKKVHA